MEAALALLRRDDDDSSDSNDDKNIGSARGTSTSAFLSTFIVNFIIFSVLVILFTLLRRSNKRIYAPRTYVRGIPDRWGAIGSNALMELTQS